MSKIYDTTSVIPEDQEKRLMDTYASWMKAMRTNVSRKIQEDRASAFTKTEAEWVGDLYNEPDVLEQGNLSDDEINKTALALAATQILYQGIMNTDTDRLMLYTEFTDPFACVYFLDEMKPFASMDADTKDYFDQVEGLTAAYETNETETEEIIKDILMQEYAGFRNEIGLTKRDLTENDIYNMIYRNPDQKVKAFETWYQKKTMDEMKPDEILKLFFQQPKRSGRKR